MQAAAAPAPLSLTPRTPPPTPPLPHTPLPPLRHLLTPPPPFRCQKLQLVVNVASVTFHTFMGTVKKAPNHNTSFQQLPFFSPPFQSATDYLSVCVSVIHTR